MYEDTPLWIVEDDETLRDVAQRLAKAPAIGVDTESDSFYSYREKVCLLQISDLENDYVIDPLAVPGNRYFERIEGLFAALAASGVERLPAERRYVRREKALRDGIPVDEAQWAGLRELLA